MVIRIRMFLGIAQKSGLALEVEARRYQWLLKSGDSKFREVA